MLVGSLAGVAVLYELVSMAHNDQLAARLHSPSNVWLLAVCVFVFGWGLATIASRVGRWFGLFAAAGGWAAGSIAASNGQKDYAVPLLCLGLAAALMVFASFRGDRQLRRSRTA